MTVLHPTLSRTLLPAHSRARDLALIVGGAAFVAVLAQGSIPLQPVPLTLQTLGVLLVGAALGWKRALAALLLYVAAGAAGLPIYAGGGSGVLNPAGTGLRASLGYLIGFPFAAALVGFLVERFALDRKFLGTCLAMLAGNVVIYLFGLPVLGAITGLEGQTLLTAGLTPFLLGDTLKLLLAALLLPGAWALLRR
ncbi:biotin transporter BioY [Deinococcus multiflagellatus]|uniref:Biotin transporter n=1 Tax=Deinococcus multiflagellatus TaxID=1656887 RepID=A0ABW1ZMG6_9DEIO|nr:biotin transporter BioY [Deinococcus multiflagellatus]MBZ9712292.1 biotin transporter BioY [Deinococcus multiflagellatus]